MQHLHGINVCVQPKVTFCHVYTLESICVSLSRSYNVSIFNFKTIESVLFSTNIIAMSNDKCDSITESLQEHKENAPKKMRERQSPRSFQNGQTTTNEKSGRQDAESETGPGDQLKRWNKDKHVKT